MSTLETKTIQIANVISYAKKVKRNTKYIMSGKNTVKMTMIQKNQ